MKLIRYAVISRDRFGKIVGADLVGQSNKERLVHIEHYTRDFWN